MAMLWRVIHMVAGIAPEKATARSSASPPQRSVAGSMVPVGGDSTHGSCAPTVPRPARGQLGATGLAEANAVAAVTRHAVGSVGTTA